MAVVLEERAGGQVRVETGRGIITGLGPTGGRNRQVTFKATHVSTMVEPVTAWLDTEQQPAMVDLVVKAHAARRELEYRIEVKRKAGVDPAPAIGDLARRDKVRDLVYVGVPGAQTVSAGEGEVLEGLAGIMAVLIRIESRLVQIEANQIRLMRKGA